MMCLLDAKRAVPLGGVILRRFCGRFLIDWCGCRTDAHPSIAVR